MRLLVDNVARFHALFRIPVLLEPTVPPIERVRLRIRLIEEECVKELLPALRDIAAQLEEGVPVEALRPLMVKVADGIIDTIVVCVGTGLEFGLTNLLSELWATVHSSNLAKVGGSIRPDGKICKPIGWRAPDIYKVLYGKP